MNTSTDLIALLTPRPIEEWHEDLGPQLWWTFPLREAPYLGSPLDCGQTVEVVVRYYKRGAVYEKTHRHMVGEWPGYHTHFTPIPHITPPAAEAEEEPDPIAQAFTAPIEPTSSALSPRGRGAIAVAEGLLDISLQRMPRIMPEDLLPCTESDANHPVWNGLKLSQRQRCARAVMHLRMYNALNRKDIMSVGEVSWPQASIDFKEIQKRCPGLMHYDVRKKHYVLTSRK